MKVGNTIRLAAIIGAILLSSTAPAVADTTTAATYVALGDSYASAAGVPNQSGGLCLRSDHNYAHVVASAFGASLTDVTCAGAITDNIAGPQTLAGAGPQTDALTAATQLVTITIGGNDIGVQPLGIASVIGQCGTLYVFAPFWQSNPCQKSYGNQLSDKIATTGPKVAQVLATIHHSSPQAKVLLVGYPAFFPESSSECSWPPPLRFGDIDWLRGLEKNLNAELSTVAAADGNTTYVDTYTPTIGHDMCKSGTTQWINGPVSKNNDGVPYHPNTSGEQAMATAVEHALGQ